jgi:hypothetical protein
MPTLTTTPQSQFAYQKPQPFSNAELEFRIALADYATARLLPILQRRTVADRAANQYTGINVRLAHHALYLEAILTHDSEWGGFGFDFARLYPVKDGRYNLSLRPLEDWMRAEQCTISSAATYFTGTGVAPPITNWVSIAASRTFEECIELVRLHLPPEHPWEEEPTAAGQSFRG